jgi:presequence protease
MCISFVGFDVRNYFDVFAFRVISSLLLDGSSSPMHKALIDSGLAPEYAPGTGFDSSRRCTSFTVGVQGIKREDVDAVEKRIWKVLQSSCNDSNSDSDSSNVFSMERVEAVLHQIELQHRHVSANFGLNLVQSVAPLSFYGVNVVDALRTSSHVDRIRKDLTVLPNLLKKYVLHNKQQVRIIMSPDQKYTTLEKASSATVLENFVSKLADSDKEKLFNENSLLQKRQAQKQDLSVLPCLKITDIEPKERTYPIQRLNESVVFTRETNTNGVNFLKSIIDIPKNIFNDSDLRLLPLLGDVRNLFSKPK